jgi:hypothetical protein
MPKPMLTKPSWFPHGLHKGKGHKDTAIIYGTNIKVGDRVDVNGTHGQKPTHWQGRLTRDNGDGLSFTSDDLTVDSEEQREGVRTGGPEDVTTTVSNGTDTSNTVITPQVPTVP